MANEVKPYQILIVDDDPQVHKLLGKMLPAERYQIQSTFNADEAKLALKKTYPDLIILDVMMPKTSGMQLLDYIRNESEFQDVLVLILSAKDAQSDRLNGLTRGADDYVSKPFHIRHLVRKIEHMVSKSH